MSTVDAATSAVIQPAATATATNDAATQALADYDDFLTLLTAQLSNQDPLDPEDSTEFVEQIATFTTVEQQINTNDKLDQLIALQTGSAVEELGRYVGREVFAEGLNLTYSGADIQLSTPTVAGGEVEVVIRDESGVPVARLPADGRGGAVTWDGSRIGGSTAAPGVYTVEYEITRQTPSGQEVETQTPSSAGRVVEARYDDNGQVELVLEGGVVMVRPADVQAVFSSPAETAAAPSSTLEQVVDAADDVVDAAEDVVAAVAS